MNLLTERLSLRPWRDDDLPSLIALNTDPAVNRWLGGPLLASRSAEALTRMQSHLTTHGWGVLLVEERAGRFLGLAGLQPVRAHLPVAPATEIVWRLRSDAWGQGYASEAAAAILAASAQHGAPTDIVSIVAAANLRSARTAGRIGLRHESALDFLHPDLGEHDSLRPHRVFVTAQSGRR